MEKFDKTIEQAKTTYQPRADFVDATMRKIQPRRRSHLKLWSILLTSGLALAGLAFIVLPRFSPSVPTGSTTPPSSQQTLADQPSGATDNATLTNDLNGIQNSMNTASSDQNSSDAALNDSQQQVTIPTE